LQQQTSAAFLPVRTRLCIVSLLVVILASSSARCAVTAEGILRLTTNYDYRGYSKSDDDGTIQANFDAVHSSGFFLGAWVSAIDIDGADLELNPYLGTQFNLSPDWQIATSLSGYFYDEQVMYQNADYAEGMLQLEYRDIGSARLHIAPDYFGTGHTVSNYELELRYPLADNIELSGVLGYQSGRDALNYDIIHANIGIAWFVLPRLTLDFRYHDSHKTREKVHDEYDAELFSGKYLDPAFIFSISIGFY